MRTSRRELELHLEEVLSGQVNITVGKTKPVKPQDGDETPDDTLYTVDITYTNNVPPTNMNLLPGHLQDLIYRHLSNGFCVRGTTKELETINFLAIAIDFALFLDWTVRGYSFVR